MAVFLAGLAAAAAGADEGEIGRWQKATGEDSCAGYAAFIGDFPDSPLRNLAQQKFNDKGCAPKPAPVTQTGTPVVPPPNDVGPTPVPAGPGPGPVVPSGPGPDEERLWNWASIENDCPAYRRYLNDYPNGFYAKIARRKSADCERVATPVAPPVHVFQPLPLAKPVVTESRISPTPPPPPPPPADTAAILATIDTYYRALDQADVPTALSLWVSPPSQVAGNVANNEYFRLNERRVVSAVGDTARVYVDATGKNRGFPRVERWRLYVDLRRQGGVWKIERMGGH